MKKIMFQIRKKTETTEMRKEEIHLIQGDTIYATAINTDPKIEATITIPQKITIANIIHHAKDNTQHFKSLAL